MRLQLSHNVVDFLQQAGRFCIIATCFFIPLSTSFMGLFAALSVLFWLLSGDLKKFPDLLTTSPAIQASSLLFLLFLIGMFYSPAGWEEIIDNLKKYRELVYIPLVISLMNGHPRDRRRAVIAFAAGCITLLLVSYGMSAGLLPTDRYGNSLVYHITHNFFMAILAFGAAHALCETGERKGRLFWAAVLAATVINILYFAPGRTGMITFLFLILLFIRQRASWKTGLLSLVLFALAVGGVFATSPSFSGRMQAAITEIRTYRPGMARTSMGQRLDWWYDSWQLIRQEPIFGHGTGSFALTHDELIRKARVKPTDNPHNEYLFIGVQLGLVGMAAFLGLFIAQWYSSLHMQGVERWLLQGVIFSMALGCLANSFLFDSHQGHYFAFLSGVLLSSPEKRRF